MHDTYVRLVSLYLAPPGCLVPLIAPAMAHVQQTVPRRNRVDVVIHDVSSTIKDHHQWKSPNGLGKLDKE
eukprot:5114741-Karenia_brevis.AAC.1